MEKKPKPKHRLQPEGMALLEGLSFLARSNHHLTIHSSAEYYMNESHTMRSDDKVDLLASVNAIQRLTYESPNPVKMHSLVDWFVKRRKAHREELGLAGKSLPHASWHSCVLMFYS